MNKLDELIEKVNDEFYKENSYSLRTSNPEKFAKRVAIEFAKHILEEAAENAKMYDANEDCHYEAEDDTYLEDYRIDKQSITEVLDKYLKS